MIRSAKVDGRKILPSSKRWDIYLSVCNSDLAAFNFYRLYASGFSKNRLTLRYDMVHYIGLRQFGSWMSLNNYFD